MCIKSVRILFSLNVISHNVLNICIHIWLISRARPLGYVRDSLQVIHAKHISVLITRGATRGGNPFIQILQSTLSSISLETASHFNKGHEIIPGHSNEEGHILLWCRQIWKRRSCDFTYLTSLLFFQAETNAEVGSSVATLLWCGSHPKQEQMSALPEGGDYSSLFETSVHFDWAPVTPCTPHRTFSEPQDTSDPVWE